MKGGPAGLMRRAQMSDEIRSGVCPSRPLSISTTFLPDLASTAANVEPDAPAPAITMSTFSSIFPCAATSPPLFGCDVGHAEALISFHRAVDDIDGIAAQYEIGEPGSGRPLPSLDLVLAKLIDEIVLLGRRQRGEPLAAARLACLVDATDHAPIEVDEGRLDVDDACFEQRFTRRPGDLLVDEVRDACLA